MDATASNIAVAIAVAVAVGWGVDGTTRSSPENHLPNLPNKIQLQRNHGDAPNRFRRAILIALALLSSSTDAFLPPSSTKVGSKLMTTLSAFPPEFILGSPDSEALSPLVEEARGKF